MAALVGGWDGKRELASAKLLTFDGSAKGMRWEALPELPAPVVNPALTADAEGRLLVCGGKRGGNPLRDVLAFAASTGRWEPFSQLRIARDGARAVLLHDGRVLVIGGSRGATDLASCETFDPATGRWIGGPSMHSGRRSFGAAVMPDGRVVVAGGFGGAGTEQAVGGGSGDPAMEVHVSRTPLAQLRDRLDSAEVFDPSTNSWSLLPRMSTLRDGCALCVLSEHEFGVFGGCGNGSYQRDCESFSFVTGVWSALPPMSVGRAGCVAVAGPAGPTAPCGLPLVLGGACDENPAAVQFLKSMECYVPSAEPGKLGEWQPKPEMDVARQWAGMCQYSL